MADIDPVVRTSAQRFVDTSDLCELALDDFYHQIEEHNEVRGRYGEDILGPFRLEMIKANARIFGGILRTAGVGVVLLPQVYVRKKQFERLSGNLGAGYEEARQYLAPDS